MEMADIISPVSAATAAIAILLSFIYYFIKNRNILPGPTGLPYFGLFFKLKDKTCHLQLKEIGGKYGDLYSFTYLGNLIICLGSAKCIRELHLERMNCFADRYTEFGMLSYTLKNGFSMSNGEAWKTLRRYFIGAFKEYGLTVTQDNMRGPIYDSLTATMEDISAHKGRVFNVVDILLERCTETMQKVLFGEHAYKQGIQAMNKAYETSLNSLTGVTLLYIGPLAKQFFFTCPKLRKALAHHEILRELLHEIVIKIKSSLDENHVTCLVEDFYAECNKKKRENDPTHVYFTDTALVSSLTQIVSDGIVSVAHYIATFLYALVEHPEEQDKLYKEIMELIGPSRMPDAEDKVRLAYTNAFMNEVVRTTNFIQLFPSVVCTEETTIRGYRIPKGSITLLNFWSAHHDPHTYEDPYRFDPSRYIPAPEKPRPELPILFGLGRRACSAEPFISMQAFLFLTTIVKNFTVSQPGISKPKSDSTLISEDIKLSFQLREAN